MCGIVGAVSRAPVDGALVEQMRDRLVHRGPDHAGSWLSADTRVCLGHRRLAILDLTPEANQPWCSHDGRFVITFNGEIYNHRNLREQLRAHNVSFRTQSDTEVLVESFRHWGDECLVRLAGMFAFAIWDTLQRRLFCARDRAGEKPFYYTHVEGAFLFASELKALLLWPGFRKRIHYPALIDYLSFGFVPDPKAIWEGCWKLPPGHSLSVRLPPEGSPEVGDPVPYWDMEFDPDYSVTDWHAPILDNLQSACGEMSVADVPVGTFLSGGVDSSSVTAGLSKAGCRVNTFTVGFDEQGYDERPWARQVASIFGTNHTERLVQADDVAPVFQKILWHYDEPFNDYSYLPTFYVCREARKTITVALSGDGGDELFAGYTKYRRLGLRSAVQARVPQSLLSLAAAGVRPWLPEASSFRDKVDQYAAEPTVMLTDMLTGCFHLADLRLAARGPLADTLKHYDPTEVVLSLLRKAPPAEVGLVNAMRYLDLKVTLAGGMLVKVDRASMAVSLEVRPVYLHRDMLALAARIPPGLLADRNQSKKLLKSALRAWLPESILYRPKRGFAMPLRNWINGDLRQLFGRRPEPDPTDELLDPTLAARLANSQPQADFTARIHSLVFLRQWFAKWV